VKIAAPRASHRQSIPEALLPFLSELSKIIAARLVADHVRRTPPPKGPKDAR